jgi:hypothetical protein
LKTALVNDAPGNMKSAKVVAKSDPCKSQTPKLKPGADAGRRLA